MMQTSMKMQRGVTLMEILVASCIVIVLMLVLFPMPHGNRERSRQASCASNMKQIGLGLIQYAQDNDGALPIGLAAQAHPQTARPGLGWAGQVYPYIKSVNIFRCPDDDEGDAVISYGYNRNLVGTMISWEKPTGYVGSFTDPGKTVAVFEVTNTVAAVTLPDEGASQGAVRFSPIGDGTEGSLRSVQSGLDKVQYATGYMRRPTAATDSQFAGAKGRHIDSSNFLFVDGHVKWFRPLIPVSTGANASNQTAAQTGGLSGTAAGTGNPNYAATFSVK